jgi:hypothetical protein
VTLEHKAFVVLAPFMLACLLWILPQWWRNERGLHTDTPSPTWIWGLALWHAAVRLFMPLGMSFAVAIPGTAITILVTHGPMKLVGDILLGIGAFIWIFVIPPVVLFNRPRFVLAPHHRALPGLLAEWRGAPVPPVPEPAKPPRWHAAAR